MKFIFELVSEGKYMRYRVISESNGERTTCGFLDLTTEEAAMFKHVLNNGNDYQDGELKIEFTAVNPSLAVYAEGVVG